MTETIIACKECGCNKMIVKDLTDITCENCENNGVRNEEKGEHEYRALKKGEERTEEEETGECLIGEACGAGCYLIECSNCKKLAKHIPIIDY